MNFHSKQRSWQSNGRLCSNASRLIAIPNAVRRVASAGAARAKVLARRRRIGFLAVIRSARGKCLQTEKDASARLGPLSRSIASNICSMRNQALRFRRGRRKFDSQAHLAPIPQDAEFHCLVHALRSELFMKIAD